MHDVYICPIGFLHLAHFFFPSPVANSGSENSLPSVNREPRTWKGKARGLGLGSLVSAMFSLSTPPSRDRDTCCASVPTRHWLFGRPYSGGRGGGRGDGRGDCAFYSLRGQILSVQEPPGERRIGWHDAVVERCQGWGIMHPKSRESLRARCPLRRLGSGEA